MGATYLVGNGIAPRKSRENSGGATYLVGNGIALKYSRENGGGGTHLVGSGIIESNGGKIIREEEQGERRGNVPEE